MLLKCGSDFVSSVSTMVEVNGQYIWDYDLNIIPCVSYVLVIWKGATVANVISNVRTR